MSQPNRDQDTPPIEALWAALTAAATLGTERRAFAPPLAAGALSAALAQIAPVGTGENALLSTAALLSSYDRAGQLPMVREPPAAPSIPAEQLSACSSTAVQHVQAMLHGSYRALLPEWLQALAANHKRVPYQLLPRLLEAGRSTAELRALIRPVIGARGQWLAAQNRDWHYASVAIAPESPALEQATELWDTGTRAARLALLEELRALEPAAARELIASSWSSEKADDRSAFIEQLRSGLSMGDEPFLEAALDDRSKEVRRVAVDLLAGLPASRLVQRMTARVQPLLHWTPPEGKRLLGLVGGRAGKIDITLPVECDKAMARDGVDPKPPVHSQGLGERAQWLWQMLRVVPPARWAAQWQATPEHILTAAAQTEWNGMLLWAWADAAQFSRDQAWAEAILRADPQRAALLPILPIDRQEAVLIAWLADKQAITMQNPVFTLLRGTTHQWSPALLRALLRMLRQLGTRPPDRMHYLLTSLLNEAAYRIQPTLLPEIQAYSAEWRDAPDYWKRASENLLGILQFRQEMHTALRDA